MTITTKLTSDAQFRNFYPVNVMTTNLNAVTPGGNAAGWVSGDPRNMPISTTVNTVFDLGPDWTFYSLLQVSIIPGWVANALTIQVTGSDSTAFTSARRLQPITATSAPGSMFYTVTGVSVLGSYTRPIGRFVILQWATDTVGTTNASAAVTLAAYPGV